MTVVKTFALSKLIYPFTVLPNPSNKVIKEINKDIVASIWNSKPDKVKRNVMYHDYNSVGVKLINIEMILKSIKAVRLKILNDDKGEKGKSI